MASYRGSPFEAGVGPADNDVVLFAACPPPEELGFEPATGHWRKRLPIQDVEAMWESRPVGVFRGARCIVLDDLGDRLHIGYLGHDGYQAEALGYWQVDRGVFELVAHRFEVTEIIEERTEYRQRREAAARGNSAHTSDAPSYSPGQRTNNVSGFPPAESSGYLSTTPAGSSPGYLPSGPIGYRTGRDSGGYSWAPAAEHASQPAADAPLPLEAAALRAASEARHKHQARGPLGAGGGASDGHARPATGPLDSGPHSVALPALAGATPVAAKASASQAAGTRTEAGPMATAPATTGQSPSARAKSADRAEPATRGSARHRLATEKLFAELASLAAIPVDSYAVGEEVEGAMCLLQTDQGFEVFHSSGGKRHELQFFTSEEAACFYLFGVLSADAVRNGSLVPQPGHLHLPFFRKRV